MARLLHISRTGARPWCRALMLSGLIACLGMCAGCILPPELPAETEEQFPPYIDPNATEPPLRFVEIVRAGANEQPTITFSVEVLDRNPHDQMYFALVNDQRRVIVAQGSVGISSNEENENGELVYRYLISIENFELCEGAPESGVETFTMYVADNEFRRVSAVSPEPPELVGDGFIVSRSWVLEYAVDACS